jgi:hypothetical protein
MASRICDVCDIHWPVSGYGLCPVCRTPTHYSMERPVPSDQAERLANALKFERYYERREAQRVRSGQPSPEELGSRDAQEELDQRKDGA